MNGVWLTVALLGCTVGGGIVGVFALAICISGRESHRCMVCGCTEWHACPGGCWWVSLDPPLCSTCSPGWAA